LIPLKPEVVGEVRTVFFLERAWKPAEPKPVDLAPFDHL
jgi:hypothetical protein